MTRSRPLVWMVPLGLWLFLLSALVGYPAWADEVVNDISHKGSGAVAIDPAVLAFLLGALMPLLTGLLTKLSTSSGAKAVLNLVLSIAAGVLAAFAANPNHVLTWLEIATAAILAYTGSGVTYHNLWKPTGASAAAQRTLIRDRAA